MAVGEEVVGGGRHECALRDDVPRRGLVAAPAEGRVGELVRQREQVGRLFRSRSQRTVDL